jgi:hypothetical protein
MSSRGVQKKIDVDELERQAKLTTGDDPTLVHREELLFLTSGRRNLRDALLTDSERHEKETRVLRMKIPEFGTAGSQRQMSTLSESLTYKCRRWTALKCRIV